MNAVAILIPVLGRPQHVPRLLANIATTTPEPHRVLFIADTEDLAEIKALDAAGADYITRDRDQPRNYAAKINCGYHATTEPFVFTGADDLNFHRDWFSRALAWAHDHIGVIGTNDIANPRVMNGTHSTHSLVRRSYVETQSGVIDTPDTVYCELYGHEYTDDELVQTAMFRGVYAHAFDSIVEHLHPMVGKAEDDATYRKGRSRTVESQRTFIRRSRMWTSPAARPAPRRRVPSR